MTSALHAAFASGLSVTYAAAGVAAIVLGLFVAWSVRATREPEVHNTAGRVPAQISGR